MNAINLLKSNDFMANVLKLIAGTALGQLITVLISPVLTRIYTPDDFGILAIYVSIVSIISVIISLRYETAIMLPDENDEAVDLVILSTGIAFGLSLFFLLVIIFFNQKIVDLIEHPELSFYLYLIPLSTFFFGSFQILSYWMSRIENFSYLAISKTTKESTAAGTQLLWGGFIYSGPIGLIAGQIAGNMMGAGMLFFRSINQITKNLKPGLFKNLKYVFFKYKQFPLYTSWATLINALSQNIPALLLAFFFSPATAGFYAVATRVISIPAALIGTSVRQVYFQKASMIYNEGLSIYQLFKKTTLQLVLLGIIPFTIIIIWGSSLFAFILGPSWEEAGIYASILSLWLFFTFINPPSVMSLFILKLNKTHLIYEILLLIFRVIALITGFLVNNNVLLSLGLYTIVGIIFNLILIGVIHFNLTKK
jgi:O-antigen/teichoic acid export membrane protein